MGLMTDEDSPTEQLAGALARVAADPDLTRHLHEVLGAYCHRCRNHLNSLKISLYLARRVGGSGGQNVWRDLEPRYELVERFVDRLQLICRPMPLSLVRLPLSLLIDDRRGAWSEQLQGQGRRLIVSPPEGPEVGDFDPMRLGQGLDGLVSWRSRAGDPGSDLRVSWTADRGTFHVVWDEPPGPGPDPGFGPPDGSAADSTDALALPLLTRLMTLHGGALLQARRSRWRLDLRWPIDARSTLREPQRC
jgi:hypothetical protein